MWFCYSDALVCAVPIWHVLISEFDQLCVTHPKPQIPNNDLSWALKIWSVTPVPIHSLVICDFKWATYLKVLKMFHGVPG